MKKYFLYALMLCAFISCKDNSGLYGLLADMDNRIAEVEQQCEQINTNIDALEALVEAQQTGDYITAIIPIKEGDVEIGYTITFAKHDPITIYHGKNGKDGKDGQDGQNGTNGTNGQDGQDGHSPVIGVAQDTDGVYYWTIDGEWMLDGNGQKLRVTGRDGQDGQDGLDGQDGTNGTNGITPQLKIENDYWFISYDNGTTWTQLGKAKGDDGADGQDGDSMFQSVTQDDLHVYFTLTNGTTIVIVKANSDINDFEQTIKDNLVNSLTIDKTHINILLGSNDTIVSTTAPFPDSKVIWTSSNTNVATIENGVITGLSYGYTLITAQSATLSKTCQVYVVDDLTKYAFSVSSSKKVYFAKGNLQYKANGKEWRFASQQYESIGVKQNSAGWSDYFHGSVTRDTTFGNLTIVNASSGYNSYRLLSKSEWNYVASRSGKFVFGNIEGHNGLILLPDNWVKPSGISYTAGNQSGYTTNNFSYTEWAMMENNGAIFLPASGELSDNSISGLGTTGKYFSSNYSSYGTWSSDILEFYNGKYLPSGSNTATNTANWNTEGSYGLSIRLVQTVK